MYNKSWQRTIDRRTILDDRNARWLHTTSCAVFPSVIAGSVMVRLSQHPHPLCLFSFRIFVSLFDLKNINFQSVLGGLG